MSASSWDLGTAPWQQVFGISRGSAWWLETMASESQFDAIVNICDLCSLYISLWTMSMHFVLLPLVKPSHSCPVGNIHHFHLTEGETEVLRSHPKLPPTSGLTWPWQAPGRNKRLGTASESSEHHPRPSGLNSHPPHLARLPSPACLPWTHGPSSCADMLLSLFNPLHPQINICASIW